MEDKDINSKEDAIIKSIEDQFDDLFSTVEPEKDTSAQKKPSSQTKPEIKKEIKKALPVKPVNKKVISDKDNASKKMSPAESVPEKTKKQKVDHNKAVAEKKIPPVQTARRRPSSKQNNSGKNKEMPSEEAGNTPVENVFKKANQEFEKNDLWDRVKQNLNSSIFILLILILVLLSLFTGMIIGSGGMFGFMDMKTSSTFTSDTAHTSPAKKNRKSISKKVETPPPETATKKIKIEDPDIKEPEKIVKVEPDQSGMNQAGLNKENTEVINSEKKITPQPEFIEEDFISYPYSIYLGSYNSVDKVDAASSGYSERGIISYHVKLDLGEKGIWFRHFAGYFITREQADEFIRARQLKDGESRLTKYANLIGIFRSKEDAERQKSHLEEMGYSAYVISDKKDAYRLFIGAFYQKGRAEDQKNDLELKGIKSRIIER